jgi:hypothetical protein
MVRRNRPSQLKREREQKKRERQRRKADKAAMKREKRFGNSETEDASPPEPHAEIMEIGPDAKAEPEESS